MTQISLPRDVGHCVRVVRRPLRASGKRTRSGRAPLLLLRDHWATTQTRWAVPEWERLQLAHAGFALGACRSYDDERPSGITQPHEKVESYANMLVYQRVRV